MQPDFQAESDEPPPPPPPPPPPLQTPSSRPGFGAATSAPSTSAPTLPQAAPTRFASQGMATPRTHVHIVRQASMVRLSSAPPQQQQLRHYPVSLSQVPTSHPSAPPRALPAGHLCAGHPGSSFVQLPRSGTMIAGAPGNGSFIMKPGGSFIRVGAIAASDPLKAQLQGKAAYHNQRPAPAPAACLHARGSFAGGELLKVVPTLPLQGAQLVMVPVARCVGSPVMLRRPMLSYT